MLKMSQSFVIRMTLWSVLILYMVCDFFVFKGPLQNELKLMFRTPEDQARRAMSQGICAKVWNGPIYRSQVDRRVREKLWRTGRDPEKVSDQEMKLLRWAALDELIDECILRIKVRANRDDFPVSDTEIDTEVAQFEKRFSSAGELDKALEAQGIKNREELRYRLAARIQQEKYLQEKTKDATHVTSEEAKQWYDDHAKELKLPERRYVRHIFLATLDHPSEQAKATLTKHLERLKKGQTNFKKLAADVSEDASTKSKGGDLGWVRKKRLPGDFAAAVFSLSQKSPTLVRTKLGWHIIEVTDIKAPELPTFKSMEKEITTALADSKREGAIKQYRHQIRLLNKDKIDIFKPMME